MGLSGSIWLRLDPSDRAGIAPLTYENTTTAGLSGLAGCFLARKVLTYQSYYGNIENLQPEKAVVF